MNYKSQIFPPQNKRKSPSALLADGVSFNFYFLMTDKQFSRLIFCWQWPARHMSDIQI